MNCEICGKEIRPPGYRIIVEGTELRVCASCRKYGTESVPTVKPDFRKIVLRKRKPQKKVELEEELVENFNVIIRVEREKRGWSQEQLAKKIQEKESVIKKIENAEITPEPKIIEKLEKLFGIKLRESPESIRVTKPSQFVPTFGDIVVVRRKE
ncbi:MAG: multiprotein bridging factor aMBF1 [Archaeoglobaceae archaeon]